jgi:hypothetical protein
MIAPAAQEALIPSAACFHIGNGDERLRTHSINISISDWNPNVRPGATLAHSGRIGTGKSVLDAKVAKPASNKPASKALPESRRAKTVSALLPFGSIESSMCRHEALERG